MKFKRRLKVITLIALLLTLEVGGGLSGNPIDVFAAEGETGFSEDETESSEDETESSEDETDPSEDETDPSEDETDPSEDETDPSEDETDPSGDETDPSEDEEGSSGDEEDSSLLDIAVPIYDYDILNVLVPTSYKVAFNPYGLNINLGEDKYFNGQVISRNYGIVNASARDKLVTLTLTVEDLNDGQITFVDSAEAARNADAETLAVYLALVPADDGEITVNNRKPDKDITAESLTDVSMGKSTENAVTLQAGENQVTFKLSGAVYGFIDGDGLSLDDGSNQTDSFRLMKLAPDGTGVTAFTFDGAMNPDADWTRLQKGIRISVVYNYENTTGTEMIAEGTGAMVKIGGEE